MQANGSSSAQDPQSFWTNISCMIASVQKNPKRNPKTQPTLNYI